MDLLHVEVPLQTAMTRPSTAGVEALRERNSGTQNRHARRFSKTEDADTLMLSSRKRSDQDVVSGSMQKSAQRSS